MINSDYVKHGLVMCFIQTLIPGHGVSFNQQKDTVHTNRRYLWPLWAVCDSNGLSIPYTCLVGKCLRSQLGWRWLCYTYIDPWRLSNPNSKVFYFSLVHGTFSRIDYFFIDRAFLPSVKSMEYLPIVILDHAPLQLDISFTLNQKDRPLWRLNPLLISD